MKVKFAVLGAGSFGLALCKLISQNENYEVILWSAIKEEIETILKYGKNDRFLPGIVIKNSRIKPTINLEDIVNCDIIFFAVASAYIRQTLQKVKPFINKNCILINIAKGFEISSLKTISQIFFDEIKSNENFIVLSGPSHAEELAKFAPTAVVAASCNLLIAERLQNLLNSTMFKIYISNDVIGVEIGGALKNTIALAVGICEGLGLGENTKAALMTRGIFEICKIGVKLGAKNETFMGLSGIGDLIATCSSNDSRNKKAGFLIGSGETIETALKKVGMVVEGYQTTLFAHKLAEKLKINIPTIDEIYNILFKNGNVLDFINKLMIKPVKYEY